MKKAIVLIFSIITGCSAPGVDHLLKNGDDFVLKGFTTNENASPSSLWIEKKDILLEFGAFDRVLTNQQRGAENYIVEFITFSKQKNAIAAYFFTRMESSIDMKINHYGRKVKNTVQLVKGNYLISVAPSSNGTSQGAHELAELFSNRIRAAFSEPDIFTTLPLTSRIENSAFCFMGEKAFTSRFSPELAGMLMVNKMVEGYSALYGFEKNTSVLFKIKYRSYLEAREAMNLFIESNPDAKVLPSQQSLGYFAVINDFNSQDLITSMGEWLYLMRGVNPKSRAQNFFEFVLRGGK